MPFDHAAWLEDHQLAADDEDFEWTCRMIVLADSADGAHAWGDRLVHKFCAESADVFLRSSVEPHVCASAVVPGGFHACPNFPKPTGDGYFEEPVVVDGEDVTARYIGW